MAKVLDHVKGSTTNLFEKVIILNNYYLCGVMAKVLDYVKGSTTNL